MRRIRYCRSDSKEEIMKNTNINVGKMARLAILVAIILVMSFTPLGYLRTPVIEITFIMIPVAIASIIVGPAGGAIAGCVFGITSFIQCFGASPFGAMLLSINPIYTFILCLIPRIIAGWMPGLIYQSIVKADGSKITASINSSITDPAALDQSCVKLRKRKTVASISASIAAPVLNTVLFVVTLYLLFGSTEFVKSFGESIWKGFVTIVGVNGLVEASVGIFAGATVSRSLLHFFPGKSSSINTEKSVKA